MLKRVSTTWCVSHDYVLKAVLDTFKSIIETLEYDDYTIGHKAGCLFDYLLSKRFILSAIWFQKLFNILTPINTVLQSKDIDLLAAVNIIYDAQNKLNDIRTQEVDLLFEQLVKEVDYFIEDK